MTDEEKEAIEWLKRLVKLNKRDNLDDTFAEILLNLIEKQSKEIEELKEIYQTGYVNGCVSKVYEINKKWEAKIKAKIEELNKDFKEYENGQEWEIQDEIRGQIDVLQSLLEKE